MRIAIWAVAAGLVLGSCGEESKAPEGKDAPAAEGGAGSVAPAQQDPAREKARAEREREIREIKATIRELERKLDLLDERHLEEREKLGDLSKIRRPYITARRELVRKQSLLASTESRIRELEKKIGESSSEKLKELKKRKRKLEKEYENAVTFRREEEMGAAVGAVEESPVKRDLDLLRAIKHKWFEITAEARRRKLPSSKAKAVSDSFRAWLGEDERRTALVDRVLGQAIAGRGRKASSFDFTDLDFYILVEILENELDKQNIAVEKRELSGLAQKVLDLQSELDAVNTRIADFLVEEGGDLANYEDLKSRREGLRTLVNILSGQVGEYARIIEQYRALQERQEEERKTILDALEEARSELPR